MFQYLEIFAGVGWLYIWFKQFQKYVLNDSKIQQIEKIKKVKNQRELLQCKWNQTVILSTVIPVPISQKDVLFTRPLTKAIVRPGQKFSVFQPLIEGPHYSRLVFFYEPRHSMDINLGFENTMISHNALVKSEVSGYHMFRKITPLFILGTVGCKLNGTRVQFVSKIIGINISEFIENYQQSKNEALSVMLLLSIVAMFYIGLRSGIQNRLRVIRAQLGRFRVGWGVRVGGVQVGQAGQGAQGV